MCYLLVYWCFKILAAPILTWILRTRCCSPPGSHPAPHQAAAPRSDRRPVPSTATTSSSWTCRLLQNLIADALPLLADHVRVQLDGGGGRCGRCDVQLGRGGRRHLVRLLHLVLLRSQNFPLHIWNLWASRLTFGFVIFARFDPWLIELWAELLLNIVILLGALS